MMQAEKARKKFDTLLSNMKARCRGDGFPLQGLRCCGCIDWSEPHPLMHRPAWTFHRARAHARLRQRKPGALAKSLKAQTRIMSYTSQKLWNAVTPGYPKSHPGPSNVDFVLGFNCHILRYKVRPHTPRLHVLINSLA